MTAVVLGLIAAGLFLLAAFHVVISSAVDLGWLGAAFLALAIVVPPAMVLRRAA